MSKPLSKPIYHNYTVLSPDGIEMFRCDRKKFDWYLRKGLAVQVDDEVIRLLFEPKGLGWAGEHFYLQDRENKCCVCGTEENLSKHHVVPYCYRRHLPDDIKNNNYFDVLPICIPCHAAYEKLAQKKKQELSVKYDAPIEGINNWLSHRPFKHARTIHKYGKEIPEERRKQMIKMIADELGKDTVTESEIEEYAKLDVFDNEQMPEFKSHGHIVAEKVESFQEFFEEWRTHFVETMKPKHLPKSWEIERDAHGRKKPN